MKSTADRKRHVRTHIAAAAASEGAPGRNSPRPRVPRCDQRKHRQFHDEASKQVTEAAQEIIRANVDKAKAGSLTHTKWLFDLMEMLQDEEPTSKAKTRESLAEILIKQLKSK